LRTDVRTYTQMLPELLRQGFDPSTVPHALGLPLVFNLPAVGIVLESLRESPYGVGG
jgi:hypothetical protein